MKSTTATIVRRLQLVSGVDADDVQALESLPIAIRQTAAHDYIVRDGERPTQCCLLIDGYAIRAKYGATGKRQILSIHIAGDIPDLQCLHLNVMDHNLMTLSPCTLGFITHDALRDLNRRRPRLAEALWRDTLIDAAMFREWIFNIGQRPARARMAHLFMEMKYRLQLIGRCDGASFDLPMTQNEYGDALGLTSIHVNRILQELRKDGLIAVNRQTVTILDEAELSELAGFDRVYLHQNRSL